MTIIYVVGYLQEETGVDIVVFMSESLQAAIKYYSNLGRDRIHTKYIVKTELDKEITDGMINEQYVIQRSFYISGKELDIRRKQVLKEMSSLTLKKLDIEDDIDRLLNELNTINVNLGL
jgi:hypothetical protein